MARPQSKEMQKVQKAVTHRHKSKRMTPQAAAEMYGVPVNNIYARQWWKDWAAKQKESANG